MKTGQHCPRPPPYPAHRCSGERRAVRYYCLYPYRRTAGKAFRSGGKTAGTRGLKVSASTPLGPRERVVIVEVEDARLVLGVTASSINVLHTLPLRLPRWRLTPVPLRISSPL